MNQFQTILQANPDALAIVPASYVWAAANCASNDECKQVLIEVCLRKAGDIISIFATNAHYLFRGTMASTDHVDSTCYISDDEFRFNAKPFVTPGKLLRGGWIVFNPGGIAKLEGVAVSDIREFQTKTEGTYPNVSQLWPEDYALTCSPGLPIAFNAGYLSLIGKIIDKVSDNSRALFRSLSYHNPATFEAESSYGKFGILIMPVISKGEEFEALRKAKERKDHSLASDAKELMSYRLQTSSQPVTA